MANEGPATWMLEGQPAAIVQQIQGMDENQVSNVDTLKFKLRQIER